MKRTAYLINVGRGAIVDLVDLTQGPERRASSPAPDWTCSRSKPLPADHPLWSMPNVYYSHVAGASPRIAERHTEVLLENIRRFVTGRPPTTLVDKRQWY